MSWEWRDVEGAGTTKSTACRVVAERRREEAKAFRCGTLSHLPFLKNLQRIQPSDQMKRLPVAWNTLCALATVGLLASIAPKLIRHFTYAPGGRPFWRDSWPTSVEGMSIAIWIMACGVALSSLYAGRIGKVRRCIGAVLASLVLGLWIYSGLLWMMNSGSYAFLQPSLLREMVNNDGSGLAAAALLFLLVPVASGRGVLWWSRRGLAKFMPDRFRAPG